MCFASTANAFYEKALGFLAAETDPDYWFEAKLSLFDFKSPTILERRARGVAFQYS